jgi:hypothetical protein
MSLLILMPYWEGDRKQTEDLATLLADIEPTLNGNASILFLARRDAKPIEPSVLARCKAKFLNASLLYCERHCSGYPYGPNEMFYYSLSAMFKLRGKYTAWLNLESDCVPMRKDWIVELLSRYNKSVASGKVILGNILFDHPTPHVNGVAVYPMNLVGIFQNTILGGRPDNPYDLEMAPNFLKVASDDDSFHLDFKRDTIGEEELLGFTRNGVQPIIYHGVKDDSARKIIRSKLVG